EVLDRRVFGFGELTEALRATAAQLPRDLLGVDVDRPVEIGGRVPLRGLRLLVQLHERGPAALVVPREHGVEFALDRVNRVELFLVRDRHGVSSAIASSKRAIRSCHPWGSGGSMPKVRIISAPKASVWQKRPKAAASISRSTMPTDCARSMRS